jgi:hypothetical protein
MKKIAAVLFIVLVFTVNAFAADTMTFTGSGSGNVVRVTAVCTAAADGTFTSRTISATDLGFDYRNSGYSLADVWAVNSATDDHTNAAVVTITDATGRQLVGATAGDTLSLSTVASGIAYLSIDRGSGQRAITSLLTIAIADTGSTSTVQTLYLIFKK